MRRALEMELKPGLPLTLCVFEPCTFCGWQERPFVTLVTLSLASGYFLACSGLNLVFPWGEDPYP